MPRLDCPLPSLQFADSAFASPQHYIHGSIHGYDDQVAALPLAHADESQFSNGQLNFANALLFGTLGTSTLHSRLFNLRAVMLSVSGNTRRVIAHRLQQLRECIDAIILRCEHLGGDERLVLFNQTFAISNSLTQLQSAIHPAPISVEVEYVSLIPDRKIVPEAQIVAVNRTKAGQNNRLTPRQVTAGGLPVTVDSVAAIDSNNMSFKPYVAKELPMTMFCGAQQMNWLNWSLMQHLGGDETVDSLVDDVTILAKRCALHAININVAELRQRVFALMTNVSVLVCARDQLEQLHTNFSKLLVIPGVAVEPPLPDVAIDMAVN